MEMGGLNQVDSPSGHTNEELHHFQRDRERHSLQLRQARARGGTFSELGGGCQCSALGVCQFLGGANKWDLDQLFFIMKRGSIRIDNYEFHQRK